MKSLFTLCISLFALLPYTMQAQQTVYTAGDTVHFTLTARDTHGDIITDWNVTGTSATFTVYNSTANTDTSQQSWNSDPSGYSYAALLHNISTPVSAGTNTWTINPGLFVDGVAEFSFIDTKAESDVYFEVTTPGSAVTFSSGKMDFIPGTLDNYFVDILSAVAGKDAVFLFRRYQIQVAPRDRFLNIIEEETGVYFTARWPGEYAEGEGLSKMFGGKMFISGITNYFLASSCTHVISSTPLQQITAYSNANGAIGRSDPYEVYDHAPEAFSLLDPPDNSIHDIVYQSYAPLVFRWEESVDPYTNISVTASEPLYSDDVTYTVIFVDSASLTKKVLVDSDNYGTSTQLTLTHNSMFSIVKDIAGGPTNYQSLMWLVEATDDFYTTRNAASDPTRDLPGYFIILRPTILPNSVEPVSMVASGITLSQNYPNPVKNTYPVTNIRFETKSYAPVTLAVYNMLGEKVATIVNETLAPGAYTADFNTADLPSGVYQYTLHTGGTVITKSMVVSK